MYWVCFQCSMYAFFMITLLQLSRRSKTAILHCFCQKGVDPFSQSLCSHCVWKSQLSSDLCCTSSYLVHTFSLVLLIVIVSLALKWFCIFMSLCSHNRAIYQKGIHIVTLAKNIRIQCVPAESTHRCVYGQPPHS